MSAYPAGTHVGELGPPAASRKEALVPHTVEPGVAKCSSKVSRYSFPSQRLVKLRDR